MTTPFTAACIQINAAREMEPNLVTVREMVLRAREAGADLILTPENVTMLEPRNSLLREKALPEDGHPGVALFSDLARETGAWILAGSIAIKLDAASEKSKVANRSYLFDSRGNVAAHYDKIHMFDVDLDDGESYRESNVFEPGTQAVIAETPWGRLGLTVCYDLRFAYLYRKLAQAGAEMLAVPSAFTHQTGEAHWHVLNRARAIETGCFVFAPGQCGTHAEDRQTFGHSLIIDPWGRVLADVGDEPGIAMAEIDMTQVSEARRKIPAITHDRSIDGPVPSA